MSSIIYDKVNEKEGFGSKKLGAKGHMKILFVTIFKYNWKPIQNNHQQMVYFPVLLLVQYDLWATVWANLICDAANVGTVWTYLQQNWKICSWFSWAKSANKILGEKKWNGLLRQGLLYVLVLIYIILFKILYMWVCTFMSYHMEWLWQKSKADMICLKNFRASLGVSLPFFTK